MKEIITFNYGELEFPVDALKECYHQGDCDADCIYWAKLINWKSQTMTFDDIKKELAEYGAWDDAELNDNIRNRERILWIAAGNYSEEQNEIT